MRKRTAALVSVCTTAMLVLAACGTGSGSGSKPDAIHIVESGGSSGESIKVAYAAPFTKATGIKVIQDTPPDIGKLEAMVKSGNVTADLFELGGPAVQIAKAEGLIEDLDYEAIDPEPMTKETKLPYAFGYQYFALYMGATKDVKPVKTWQEFWDTTRQPGKRAMPAYARYTLPAALLADGVAPGDLYPLDVDRALKSLDRIKDDLVLWESASQTPQLLKSGEVAYAATFDNVFAKDGFYTNFENGLFDISYFVVPKGAPHKAEAMKLLHEMSKVENQIKAADIIPLPGPSPELVSKLSPELVATMPTGPAVRDTQATSDPKWWAENGESTEKVWQAWKLKNL